MGRFENGVKHGLGIEIRKDGKYKRAVFDNGLAE
jgi:hypothetical protein